MFWFRNKKNYFQLHTVIWMPDFHTDLIPKTTNLSMDTELAHFDGKPLFLDEYSSNRKYGRTKDRKSIYLTLSQIKQCYICL